VLLCAASSQHNVLISGIIWHIPSSSLNLLSRTLILKASGDVRRVGWSVSRLPRSRLRRNYVHSPASSGIVVPFSAISNRSPTW
jgi:hypothetical protein